MVYTKEEDVFNKAFEGMCGTYHINPKAMYAIANVMLNDQRDEPNFQMWLNDVGSAGFKLVVAKRSDVNRKHLYKLFKLFVDVGLDINVVNGDNTTALMTAIYRGWYDAVEVLISLGADIYLEDSGNMTLLMHAAYTDGVDSVKIVKLLLDIDAKRPESERYINTVNANDNTALTIAAGEQGIMEFNGKTGGYHTVKLLLEYGAYVVRDDIRDPIICICASTHSNYDMVQLLIDWGADVNEMSRNGSVAMDSVVETRDYKMAELLISNGANIKNGNNNLLHALLSGFIDEEVDDEEELEKTYTLLKLLIDNGADVNGEDVLKRAVESGYYKAVELLLQNGANLDELLSNINSDDGVPKDEYNEDIVELVKSTAEQRIEDVGNKTKSANVRK